QDPDPPQARKRLHQIVLLSGQLRGGSPRSYHQRPLPREAESQSAQRRRRTSSGPRLVRLVRGTKPCRKGDEPWPSGCTAATTKGIHPKEDLCLERRFAYFCSLCLPLLPPAGPSPSPAARTPQRR